MAEQKNNIYMWPSYWQKPVAHGSLGAISCNNIYATRAGLRILAAGGNAFDAAAAVSLALSVVEPHHSGIGGGCFTLFYDAAAQKTFALDGRGTAPLAAREDLFIKDGLVQDEWKDLGGQSVALPGLLRTLDELLKTRGTKSWAEVAAPAITYARSGFGTSFTEALTFDDDSVRRKRRLSEAFSRLYLKADGTSYTFGERQTNPALADLLEQITQNGVDAFYNGAVAEAIISAVNSRGGCFQAKDMSDYRPKYRDCVSTDYHGARVVAFGPPSGGCAVLEMLNLIEQRDIRQSGHNSAETLHTLAEAMKIGFADRSIALADPDFARVDTAYITSKAFAAERWQNFRQTAGSYPSADGIDASVFQTHPGNTSHFSIMDRFGNAVSQTQTIRDWFGSGIVADGYGFVLNNAMSDFSAQPGAITSQGLKYGSANCIAGGKTPLSSMSPAIIFKDGKPFMAIGAAGGPRIITGTVQGILNAIDFGMLPEELVNAPYIHSQDLSQGLEVESGISIDTLRLLESRGHKLARVPQGESMSTMLNSVMCLDGQYYAAGTKRVDGCGGALLPNGHIVLEGVSQEEIPS